MEGSTFIFRSVINRKTYHGIYNKILYDTHYERTNGQVLINLYSTSQTLCVGFISCTKHLAVTVYA